MATPKFNTNKTDPDLTRQHDLVLKCRKLKDQAKVHRRKYDWEWLVRYLFVRGYHFARYNKGTNSVVFGTRTGVKIPINLVNAHLRGVRNQITSFKPKWEVLPSITTDDALKNARYSGKVLDHVYIQAQIKRKIKELINDALITSVGIWHFDVRKNNDLIINPVDPYDFYVDPNIKSSNLSDPEYGAEYVVWSHQLPTDYIRTNPNFNQHKLDVKPDDQPASAEYKRFLLQVTKHRYQEKSEFNSTTILNQAWVRERNKETGKLQLKLVTFVDGIDYPLREEILKDPEYPFEIYQGDITSKELYGESWVKHLIPINRVIDALESHIFEYNHFFAKGRFVIDKNSGVRVIVNQHGQIIEKNRGATVTSLPIAPLPSSPTQQIDNMRRYLEDISGVHDVTLGRLPGTIRSGTAIAELRQADANNQGDLVDNLEDFLARSGRKILKLVANNWNTAKLISVTGIGGKAEHFMAIGSKSAGRLKGKKDFKMGDKNLPLAIIGDANEVRVQVGSWLAYTKDARQEKLKEMFRLGAIDQKTYLEHSEFANIDDIIERTRTEQMLMAKASQPSVSAEKEFGVQISDEQIAIAENELMLEGVDQPVHPDDVHEIHIPIHKEHEDNPIVKAHIEEHIKMDRWQSSMASQPLPPEEAPAGGGPELPPMQGGMM